MADGVQVWVRSDTAMRAKPLSGTGWFDAEADWELAVCFADI